MEIRLAKDAWKLLHGVFCIYKPSGICLYRVRRMIIGNLCRDLNMLEERPQEQIIQLREDPSSPTGVSVTTTPNLADNVLAVGPRYQMTDIRLGWAKFLGEHTSGLCVMGVNDGGRKLLKLRTSRYNSVYQLSCRMGRATDNYHEEGRVLVKSSFKHVRPAQLDKVLASIQASHQRQMYHAMGVDIQSQEAYEMASKGPIRPSTKTDPLLYGLRCLDFNPPEFLLEVQCINEDEVFLMKLVHDIGLAVKSTAVCSRVRQVQYGHFDLDAALLRKDWTLESILNGIGQCYNVSQHRNLQPKYANLMLSNEM